METPDLPPNNGPATPDDTVDPPFTPPSKQSAKNDPPPSAPSPSSSSAPDKGSTTNGASAPIIPKDAAHPDVYMPPNGSNQYMLRYDAATGKYVFVGEKKNGVWTYYDKKTFDEINKKGGKALPPGKDSNGASYDGVTMVTRPGPGGTEIIVGFTVNGKTVYLPDGESVDMVNDVNTDPFWDSDEANPSSSPTSIPPKNGNGPDLYVPPYNGKNAGVTQKIIRWDDKTGQYVIVGENVNGVVKMYDENQFVEANKQKGKKYKPNPSNEKVETIGGINYIFAKDPKKAGKWQVVGIQEGGKNYYFGTVDAINKMNGTGVKLTDFPPAPTDAKQDVYMPPVNADGKLPPVQYRLRWDPKLKCYVTIGEYKLNADGKSQTYHEYNWEEFRERNKAVEEGFSSEGMPAPDPDHPDFTSCDPYGRMYIYRYDKKEGKYMMVGWVDKGTKKAQYLDPKLIKLYNESHTPPKPPAQTTLYDLPLDDGATDQVVPPLQDGKEGKSHFVLRYNPANNTWFVIGEYTYDKEKGKWNYRPYDEQEFEQKNTASPDSVMTPHKGDYESGNPPMIVHWNGDLQKNVIVGFVHNGVKHYFTKSLIDDINEGLDLPLDPNKLPPPTGQVPQEGAGSALGKPDFSTWDPAQQKYFLWRWDASVGRYCCVGTKDADGNYNMYTDQQYRELNQGPNGQKLPPNTVPPKGIELDPNSTDDVDQDYWLKGGFHSTPEPGGKGKGIQSPLAYPVYRYDKDGNKIMVGVQTYIKGEWKTVYFHADDLKKYNPGGKAPVPGTPEFDNLFTNKDKPAPESSDNPGGATDDTTATTNNPGQAPPGTA